MNFATQTPLIIAGLALLLSLTLLIKNILLSKRITNLLGTSTSGNLEESIASQNQQLRRLEALCRSLDEKTSNALHHFNNSIQGVGLVRFNPFDASGVKQSFCLTLIDGDANGIVLSCIHVRERMTMFCKHVRDGNLVQEASEEEHESLAIARSSMTVKKDVM